MQVDYKTVIDVLPMKYMTHFGKNMLYAMITDTGTDLRALHCKNGYLKTVKAIAPQYDPDAIKEFYKYYMRLVFSLKNFLIRYPDWLEGAHLYPNFIFKYYETYTDNFELVHSEFKALDGLILPMGHKVWRTYFPPNFLGDKSSVGITDKRPTSLNNVKLPDVADEYNIDFFEIYENNIKLFPKEPKVEFAGVSFYGFPEIDLLFQKIRDNLINKYAEECGITPDELRKLTDSE